MLAQQSTDYQSHASNIPEGLKRWEEVVDMLVEYSIWSVKSPALTFLIAADSSVVKVQISL